MRCMFLRAIVCVEASGSKLDLQKSLHYFGNWKIMDVLGFHFNPRFQVHVANFRGALTCNLYLNYNYLAWFTYAF